MKTHTCSTRRVLTYILDISDSLLQLTMSSLLEENLREAACIGDLEAVQNLVRQKVNINCKNSINGW